MASVFASAREDCEVARAWLDQASEALSKAVVLLNEVSPELADGVDESLFMVNEDRDLATRLLSLLEDLP